MLLAAWYRGAEPHLDERWGRIACLARDCDGTLLEAGTGRLLATPPSALRRAPDGGIATLFDTRPEGSAKPWPEITIGARGLRIATGPIPQYPLYYGDAADGSLFVASSCLKTLLELLGTGPLNITRIVALIAARTDGDPGATVYQRVRRVEPCVTLHVGDGAARSERHVPHAGHKYLTAHPHELAEALRQALCKALERAVGAAKRVAVFGGGGLDSSAVLAIAAAHCRGAGRCDLELLAEEWLSPGDDRPHLKTLEEQLGIVAVRFRAQDAGPYFVPSLCLDSQPTTNAAACLDMLLWSKAFERRTDVALAGHAGDFIMGGPVSFAPLVRAHRPVEALRAALRLRVPDEISAPQRFVRWIARPLLAPLLPGSAMRAVRRRTLPAWTTARFREILNRIADATPFSFPATPDEWMTYYCTSPQLLNICETWGQFSCFASVPVLDPLRDIDVVRLIAQVNPVDRTYGNMHRGLFRLAMRGLLPEPVRLRRDKALGQPGIAAAALAGGAVATLIELSTFRRLESLDLVRPAALRPTFQQWLDGLRRGERSEIDPTDAHWSLVWPLLSVEAFLRQTPDGSKTS